MRRRYKILLFLTALLVVVIGCFVILAGPWPTYKSGFEDKPYYKKALAEIERNKERLSHGSGISRFEAGWSSRPITPPTGTPLAGFGDRKGKPSTGVHDEIFVKALAVSDGTDTAVIVGADMLIIPENVAELVRNLVSKQTPLSANEILFNASHNHSGPGGFAPGFASKAFNGPYDPNIPGFLARAFTEAIVDAYRSLEPAKVKHVYACRTKRPRSMFRGKLLCASDYSRCRQYAVHRRISRLPCTPHNGADRRRGHLSRRGCWQYESPASGGR
ncbi:MAG: neutral/alkaline non-lysosomal ceramidase N-terminal domain-containing protein [Planctomycetota bacterium]|jgi:hypothetical protein